MTSFKNNKALLFFAYSWLGIIFGGALLSAYFPIQDPGEIHLTMVLTSPSQGFWLGTDHLGRDVMSRLISGARVSLLVGIGSVGISTLFGVVIGALAGYFGEWMDRSLMAFTDLMLCFPSFFLILTIVAVIDEPGIWPIVIVLGATSWMGTARLVRAEILSLKQREFVQAAKAFGASHFRVIYKHLIPNAMAPVWVTMTLGIASAILTESGLSFLGIGVQPPQASWGNMLTDGKDALGVAWWLLWSPGICILLTVASFHLVADALRHRLNVRESDV